MFAEWLYSLTLLEGVLLLSAGGAIVYLWLCARIRNRTRQDQHEANMRQIDWLCKLPPPYKADRVRWMDCEARLSWKAQAER